MYCRNCGTKAADGAKVCANCGEPLISTVYCTNCGKAISEKAVVCPGCGVPTSQAQDNRVVINNENIVGGIYPPYPPKSKFITLLLAFFGGGLGLHRFYVGKIGTGILWLLTGGLFLVGWIVDLLMIIFDGFRDVHGFKPE